MLIEGMFEHIVGFMNEIFVALGVFLFLKKFYAKFTKAGFTI